MTAALWWLLQDTVAVAVLVAIVAAVCRPLRTRPAVQHALWLVVLIKFVTPPVVVWPWTVRGVAARLAVGHGVARASRASQHDSAGASAAIRTVPPVRPAIGLQQNSATPVSENGENPPADAGDAAIAARLAELVNGLDDSPSPTLAGPEASGLPAVPHRSDSDDPVNAVERGGFFAIVGNAARSIARRRSWERLVQIVFGAWLAGGVVVGVGQLRKIARHRRLIRQASDAPTHLTNEVRRLAGVIGVRPIPALLARGVASPAVWCLGRLRLLWPTALAGEADVTRCRGVIAHELAHVRRRDHWVAWLETIAAVVWWWNPLFWLVRRRLHETAEIACDAIALGVLPGDRRQYAEAFLELSSIGKAWAPAPVLGMSTGARRTFERRFAMMLSEQVRGKISRPRLLAVGLLALVAVPSWSLGQAPSSDGRGSASASSDVRIGLRNGADPTQSSADDAAGDVQGDAGATETVSPQPPADAGKAIRKEAGTQAPASLESRVQKLEDKLDAILAELQSLRRSANPLPPMPSPDGKLVAIGRRDGIVTILDSATGKELRRIDSHLGNNVQSVTFSPDGKSLTMRSNSEEVVVDVATGQAVGVNLEHARTARDGPAASRVNPARGWRGDRTIDGPGEIRVLTLQYANAAEVHTTLQELTFGKSADLKISSVPRTNAIVVAGTVEQIALVEALVQKLDVPAEAKAAPHPVGADPNLPQAAAAAPPTQPAKSVAPSAGAATQIDLVSLGTAIIDARGALRLAQARYDRLKKMGDAKAIAQDQVEDATINRETALQKVDLLTSIAVAAVQAARAEAAAAGEAHRFSDRLRAKGFVTQSEVERAKAQAETAGAKLELLETIVSASTPSVPPPKAGDERATEPAPPPKR